MNLRKRLAIYIYPTLTATIMMTPSFNDTPKVHHEFELIEKSDQPPVLVQDALEPVIPAKAMPESRRRPSPYDLTCYELHTSIWYILVL